MHEGNRRTTGTWKKLSAAPLLLSLALPLLGQDIKVHSPEIQIRHFEMPFILEVSMEKVFALEPGKVWKTDEMKYMRCRGIGLDDLAFSYLVDKKGFPTTMKISTRFVNETPHDKRVTLLVEGFADGNRVSVQTLETKVEQNDYVDLAGEAALRPEARWAREPRPSLRMTMTMKDY